LHTGEIRQKIGRTNTCRYDRVGGGGEEGWSESKRKKGKRKFSSGKGVRGKKKNQIGKRGDRLEGTEKNLR